MYKFINKIFRLSIVLVALNVGLVNAAPIPSYTYIHGTTCTPVNLTQAINLNMTWTKDGVFNPNPLGSGRFFFIACPVVYAEDNTTVTYGSASVMLYYQDRTANLMKRTFCFIQRQAILSAAGLSFSVKTVSQTDTSPGTGPFISILALNNVYLPASPQMYRGDDQFVVVCKLWPKAGINGIRYDHF